MGGGAYGAGCPGPKCSPTIVRYCRTDYLSDTLKTLISLNKEVRPFFLGDNSIWNFPSFLAVVITAFRDPEDYLNLAIIAFGAFGFSATQILLSLRKSFK